MHVCLTDPEPVVPEVALLPERLPVVRREHDQRLLEHAPGRQARHQPPDLEVEILHLRSIEGGEALILRAGRRHDGAGELNREPGPDHRLLAKRTPDQAALLRDHGVLDVVEPSHLV